MIFVDSNIWCYYFDLSAKEHKRVSKSLETILKKNKIVTNTVVLMEVSHFLVKNLGPRIGQEKVDVLLSFPMVIVDFDFHLLSQSISMLCNYSHMGIGGRDATILASIKYAKINKLLTHDSVFKKVDWLTVIDPV